MTKKKIEKLTFEETLKELDAIVTDLENGQLPLDSALKQFERGIALSRQGQKSLTDAEQRIEILLTQDEMAPLAPFKDERDE